MIAPAGIASLSPGAELKLGAEDLKRLEYYLFDKEFEEALDEHQAMEAKLNEWQRVYDGEPRQKMRNFPWPGAANLEVPLVGFTTDSIVARILNTMFMMEPFWTIRPLRKEVDQFAKPTEHYLDWSRKAEYNLYKAVKSTTIQTVKFGWGWLKIGWEVYTRRDYTLDGNGDVQLMDEVVRRPVVYHVPDQDVVCQAGVGNDEIAEWIAHRIRLTDNQMLMRKHDNIYDNVDEVIKQKDRFRDNYEHLEDAQNRPYTREEKLNTLYEVNVAWPIDGVPVECVITVHPSTRTILRAIHNPYPWRNLLKLTFIERENQLEGFGIARRLYQLQEEMSTIHRQQVDNATVANTRFFLGKRGQIRPGTSIWPGRVLPVSDPSRDLIPHQLGDIYPSMRALEMQALAYAERASGISDPQLGRESAVAGGRATATGTLAMIQEGNRRFDLNIRDIRESLGTVGRRVLELNQRFRPRGSSYFVEGESGKYVEAILNLPPEFSASKLAVELTASTATINRETEKQGLIGLLGIMMQYYERYIQANMMLAQPQLPGQVKEAIVKVAEGVAHITRRIVQDFDIRDIDTVVPALMQAEAMNELGPGGPTNGAGGAPGGGPDPGMAALLQANGGMGGGGPAGPGRLQ